MREHNWADNYTFGAPIRRPKSIEEVCRLVADSPKIRAIGTRHSFNGIADSSGILADLRDLPPDYAIDAEGMTVTVGGATSYGALAGYLQGRGFALHNMGSLPLISVAGATATGTHGSGDRNGNLSSAVAGLEIVGPEGDVFIIKRGQDGFAGMVVGLGAFGIVTRVTLDIQPTFDMRQDAFVDLPWDSVLSNFDAISSAAYSVNMFTKWSAPKVDRLWLKTRLTDGEPRDVTAAHLGASPAPVQVVPAGEADPNDRLNPFGGVPGPWSERLPHFRIDREPGALDQIQSEYMTPRAKVVEAMTVLRGIGERIDPYLRTSEIRTMAADDLWLSPSYGQDSVGIHFTWQKAPAEVDALTREIEDLLLPLGARPHWGKLIHAYSAALAPLYPKFSDFRRLAERLDPKGKFRNVYLEKHVFS